MVEPLLKRAELAKRIPAHPQTIENWKSAGCPVARPGSPGVPHRYRESEVRAWLKAREDARKTSDVIDFELARVRKEHWQAKLAEQKHKILEGELVHVDDVRKAWDAEVAAVKARLLAVPVTLADRIHRAAVLEGVTGVEAALDDAIHEVLTELSEPDRDELGNELTDAAPARKKATKRKRKRAPAKKKTTKKRKTKKATPRKQAKKVATKRKR